MQKIRVDFSRFLSIKIGQTQEITKISHENDLILLPDPKIIGAGNNSLVSPHAANLVILGENFDYIQDLGDAIQIGAATKSQKIFAYFRDKNLAGLEFLRALPGCLGGLLRMNAGMKNHEISNVLSEIFLHENEQNFWEKRENLPIKYRDLGTKNAVILGARFKKIPNFRNEVLRECQEMRKNQPKIATFGSCFKNPPPDPKTGPIFAAKLLENVGLRGFLRDGIGFSATHANFFINTQNFFKKPTFFDAKNLIELAERRVFEAFGVKLVREVAFL